MIEGIPEGWEAVRVGTPIPNVDWIVGGDGEPILAVGNFTRKGYVVIRKKPPKPKTYRPFRNAAEYEPFRDRWIQRSDRCDSEQTIPAGCFRVTAYNDHHFWTVFTEPTSYEKAFEDGKKFDDGTPFGIEVTE